MKHDNNVRKGKVVRAVNANTLDIEIELGFGITLKRRIDLARISPENQYSEEARTFLTGHFIIEVPEVTLQFDRHPDDPNRFIAEVWDDLGHNVNDRILQEGWVNLDERLSIRAIA